LGESSRKTINDIDDLVIFNRNGLIVLYNPLTKTPIGFIFGGNSSSETPNTHPVYSAYSTKGYGPLLYELLMTYYYPSGITLDDSSNTSPDALNVWKVFNSRVDVKKEPINRVGQSPKERWLIDSCGGDSTCLDNIKDELCLHGLKFIYSLGKSKLDELIDIGDRYLVEHPELDIDEMINYLETKGGRWD